ncbi:MAG TPA: hypothetical protein VE176_12645 [Candidatus Limnocylindrales bacterium]|jgi:hypothetical protein|nr:hypothetical protein [Candidatus Limnocylindrales bacterium]
MGETAAGAPTARRCCAFWGGVGEGTAPLLYGVSQEASAMD